MVALLLGQVVCGAHSNYLNSSGFWTVLIIIAILIVHCRRAGAILICITGFPIIKLILKVNSSQFMGL